MSIDIQSVATELAQLQRNRALQSGDLSRRVGPGLSRLTGFKAERGDQAKKSFVRQLVYATKDLPSDLRFAFLRACATRSDDAPKLEDRIASVGEVLHRGPRSIRRRTHEANLLVAAKLLETAASDTGWFIGEMSSSVDFRVQEPVYKATRTLVVTAPSLDRVTEQISLQGADNAVHPAFRISAGASLGRIDRTFPQTWKLTIDLDRTYGCGDLVTFTSHFTIPRRHAPPMTVMAPRRDCWRFAASVHLGDMAESVWVLDGVTSPTLDAVAPTGPVIEPTAETEPSVEFTNLTPGLVYGLRWKWKNPDAL